MKAKVIKVIVFFLLIVAIPVLTLTEKKETVSYNENRTLASFVPFSIDGYFDRSFMNGMSDYFSDHFVFREEFIKLKNCVQKKLGKKEINGVIEYDGKLIMLFKNVDMSVTNKNINAVNKLCQKYPDSKIYFLPVFTAQEKYKTELPKYLSLCDEKEYVDSVVNRLNGAKFIDTHSVCDLTENAFYNTDHHWTSENAFNTYLHAAEMMNFEPGKFKAKTVSSDFKGTLYSKTLNEKISPDTVTAYYSENPDITYSFKNESHSTLFFEEYLSQKDKYCYFLSGNQGFCTVENKNANSGKKLLIIKDSYANCIIPMLAESYCEITVIDPRYCSVSQIKAVSPEDFDDILILFNVIGFSQEQNFSLVGFMGDN